jgi:hypothetical protein
LLDVDKSQNLTTSIRVVNTNAGSGASSRFIATSDGGNIQVKAMSVASTTYGVGDVGVINCDTMSNGLLFAHNDSVKMTLDFAGNLGLGVTPSAWSSYYRPLQAGTNGAFAGGNDDSVFTSNAYYDGNWKYITSSVAATRLRQTGGTFTFSNAASGTAGNAITWTQAMTLDASGNLLVGTTSFTNSSGGATIKSSGRLEISSTTTASSDIAYWRNANGIVGAINISGSTTTYATSSDYRLKNTIAPMTGALAKVAQLKPVTYKWNSDGSDGEGFIAHELADVVPHAVTGEKDAVDTDGNIKPQGIDTSFLVATLTAAIQEQQAMIESLRQRLSAANL